MSDTAEAIRPLVPAQPGAREGARIYNLFPRLAGPVAAWADHLPRIAAMGFNWVYVNPFHQTGFSGSLYAVQDYYALDPSLRGNAADDEAALRGFVAAAAEQGIAVMMDLVINHTAKDSRLVAEHPDWFAREPGGAIRSPFAVDPGDTSRITVWGDLAEIDFAPRAARDALVAWFAELVQHYARLGFRGFRCDAAYKVPATIWRTVIAAARTVDPGAVFAAETLGCTEEEALGLADCGFDYLFNSAKWWDFRSDWLLRQYDLYRRIAPTIAFPESHDTERLVAELGRDGVTDPGRVEALYRQRYLFAAAFSSGVLMPMGYEFGFRRKLDVVATRPDHWEEPLFDLAEFVGAVNRLKQALPVLNQEGPQIRATRPGVLPVGLLRRAEAGDERCLTLINPEASAATAPSPARLGLRNAGDVTPGVAGRAPADRPVELGGFATRLFYEAEPGAMRAAPRRSGRRAGRSDKAPIPLTRLSTRPIIIQNVRPELDGGRHAVKREVGDTLEVRAEIFKEGHDRIAAVVLHRRRGDPRWTATPMRAINPGLDLWGGSVALTENDRYEYTIEAWEDHFESWREEVRKKREAGQDVTLEVREGHDLAAAALARADAMDARSADALRTLVANLDGMEDTEARALCLLSDDMHAAVARCPDRAGAVRYDRVLEVMVDRVEARFASWYEFFPRSATDDPARHGTFADAAKRLPALQAMGFDVVYFPPIHPIGHAFRKGKNNTLAPGPDDVGSPYAIGNEEGGHTAIEPKLGTLDDFRAFVRETRAHGMEVALDYAIQCSPDHPWIKEHPEWFTFRPDGSIKHAENPPKKYQDIVNVNFYGPHQDALWRALRDIVLFWIEQGVKIFRVDNPHTKPMPFWEWMIREVKDQHPDTIFLAEAFTRPPVLKLLAKIGFCQSYTYFTWRNFKGELTEYLTDLTQSEDREYLRPNFFANTPDILPYVLQRGGRPAFRIRLTLAATLSSIYGIYSGFELCENAALPEREEYLDSEKYEIRVRDFTAPGNINDDVTKLNWIRRENPALQELDNLRFYPAHNDNVLFYGKMTPDRRNIILVVVNLNPYEAHEADIELPLDAMGLAPDAPFEVEELMYGDRHLWQGVRQHVRLDPHARPALIFRIRPFDRIDYAEPSF